MININFSIEYFDLFYWTAVCLGAGSACAFIFCVIKNLIGSTWRDEDDEFFTIFSFIFWPLFLLGLAFVCVGVFFLMSDDYLKIKKIISVPANLFCSVIRFVMKMVEKSWGFIYKTWRHFTFDRKIRKARKEVLDALVKQQQEIFNNYQDKNFNNSNLNDHVKTSN